MAELVDGLDAGRVRANLTEVREEIAAAAARAGGGGDGVEILAAVKYVRAGDLGILAEAGLEVLGENRAQDLQEKVAAVEPGTFRWDFIGQLQSRKVKTILPLVRLIHSVASDSAMTQLERHATGGTEILLEVNVAGEDEKAGISPDQVAGYLERAEATGMFAVTGLMTMPPFAADPEDSRRHFAALRELAAAHGLPRLSMGTTQDFSVAVEEGATIVRVGSRLYR
jgi:pyridoxal phosphate enzyme (YggS family)